MPPRAHDERDAPPPPQRERILDATERLVAEHGCAGTSIEAIVKAAGVSSVTFYEYFEGKEDCSGPTAFAPASPPCSTSSPATPPSPAAS